MRFGHQQKTAECFKGHTDCNMIFRFATEFRNNKSFLRGISRSAVCYKQKVRLGAAQQLYCSGQAFPVCSGPALLCQLLRRCPAKTLKQRSAISVVSFCLQHIAKLAAGKLPTQLQEFIHCNVDMNVVCLSLPYGFAHVICSENKVNALNGKRVTETLHKAVSGVLANNLILISLFIHFEFLSPICYRNDYVWGKAEYSMIVS